MAEPVQAEEGDVAALHAEIAALSQELNELKASFAETLTDNEMMGRVFDADDKMQVSMADVKRLAALD